MRRNLITLPVLALMALGSPASAQWATGGAQLNEGSETAPVFVADGAGGVREFTVYQNEIYESGITVDGTKIWCLQYGPNAYPNGITGVGDGSKIRLCAAADGVGGDVIAWSDTRTGAIGTYAQRVNASGVPTWTANGVPVRLSNKDGAEIAICGDGSGGAIIAFQPKVGITNPKFPLMLQHVLSNGTLAWGTGVAVTNLAGSDAREIRLVPDDSGGVIATWIDLALDGGVGDLYTQRVDATGVVLWGAGGVAVASVSNTIEHTARVVPDGSGGAYYAWEDNRLGYGSIHAEHVNAHGAGRWLPGFGVLVSAGESYRPQLARDPVSGNVFYGYIKTGILSPSYIAYARLSSTGASVWTEQTFGVSYCDTVAVAADGVGGVAFAFHDSYYGVFVARVANDLTETSYNVKLGDLPADGVFAVGDGRGGAVVAWRGVSADGYFSNTDYAQRLTLNGTLGQILPSITKVIDVTNDEGGFVRVQVGAAGADALSPYDATFVTGYGLWRRIEQASLAPQSALAPADVVDRLALTSRMREGTVRLQPAAAALVGLPPGAWESLGLYPAAGMSSYSFLASTRQDSTAAGRHREVFVVTAHTSTNGLVGLSFADSGSSVDNLAPPPPANLASQFSAGALHLSWSASPAADLAQYAIYRGSTAGFVPSPGSRLGYASTTAFTDGAFVAGSYYKVTALDRHGNESAWATLAPTTDVPGSSAPTVSFLAPMQPNPMRGDGMVSFGLARAGEAELAVFDLSGRRVRLLAHGPREPGEYHIGWNGRDEQGRPLPRGLYWLSLTAPGIHTSQKVVRAD